MIPVFEIIIIGSEILSGRTIDKNAPYIIDALTTEGYDVRYITVVSDNVDEIADVCRISAGRADVTLVTGGLGPTSDDRTVEGIAQAFGIKCVLNQMSLYSISPVLLVCSL